MKWRTRLSLLGLLALGLGAPPARAADHADGPAVQVDPTSDINDVFAWMSADGKVNMAMTLYPNAPATATFSNKVSYVFHTSSSAAFTGMAKAPQEDLICQFDTGQNVQCWLGTDDYISATKAQVQSTAGATSMKGKFKIFAGLRDDPFFFNLDGFKAVASFVQSNVATLAPLLNAKGCPVFTNAAQNMIRTNIVSQLSHAPPAMGGAFPGTGSPVDHFKGFNALSIVVQVDKATLTKNGATLSVWGATYKKQ